PLSLEGRRRLIRRCRTRPIAHVAAEMGISRACASEWVNRWRRHGDSGLRDRSSTPHRSPNVTPAWAVKQSETWGRAATWSAPPGPPGWVATKIATWVRDSMAAAQRIRDWLAEGGFRIDRRTVGRPRARPGLGTRRLIEPGADNQCNPCEIGAPWPGHMAHLD